ncbi:hypothetical protein C2W59_02697 [Bacillus pumilus]|uniref:Uncharacterized protein n=1 Tax=Bacillus pumilus TaxID=1408 RepID=A0AB34QWW3_BACPU|nr:hypothetical protein BAT_0678 [Bacillus pumilus ATCC 7061]KIL19803.1 hypothetical protein B4127_3667 [Bacillus pumilus]RAP15893.1 hypothetical protein C2W58_01545 [Bacillus pumilus]RAP23851.1 hypothetical protein C2W59_02697 [Bacillus pumilus]
MRGFVYTLKASLRGAFLLADDDADFSPLAYFLDHSIIFV